MTGFGCIKNHSTEPIPAGAIGLKAVIPQKQKPPEGGLLQKPYT